MKIRIMQPSDYENVYALWNQTPGMGMRSLDDSYEGILTFLNRNPNTNFVAEEDRKIVGVILTGHDGRRGYIYHMAVSQKCRRRGIGKQLLNSALNALSKEGINKAALVVYATNELGNAFWEANGFTTREDLVYRNKSLNDDNQ